MNHVLRTDHRANRRLAALEPDDLARLEPHLVLVELKRGQLLYEMGDIVHHAYFPHDTIIYLVNVMEDGNTVEVGVFGREGVTGLLSALVTLASPFTSTNLAEGRVWNWAAISD
jgi:CRP-like cAMP-binding protein